MPELSITRRLFLFSTLLLASVGGLSSRALAAPLPSRIRLLDGGKEGSDYLAAIEITLNPGYMTYWRTPGDAGLPPVFDWSGSENVADIDVSWPAPSRIDEAGSIVYGFHDGVMLPLRVKPKRADAPVSLKLKLQYGVCKEQCIPAESNADATLNGAGIDAAQVRQAIDTLPKPVKIGDATQRLSLLAARAIEDQSAFTVTMQAPAGTPVQLFAEGPEGWTFSTSEAQPGTAPGTFDVKVMLESAPAGQRGGTPVRLTARAGTEAVEAEFSPPWR